MNRLKHLRHESDPTTCQMLLYSTSNVLVESTYPSATKKNLCIYYKLCNSNKTHCNLISKNTQKCSNLQRNKRISNAESLPWIVRQRKKIVTVRIFRSSKRMYLLTSQCNNHWHSGDWVISSEGQQRS